jgi:hypothetical protein
LDHQSGRGRTSSAANAGTGELGNATALSHFPTYFRTLIQVIIFAVPGARGANLDGQALVRQYNFGYNPIGVIASPWSSNGTDLTNNVASGNDSPQSGTTYTVRRTSKTIVVTGVDVSQILINGVYSGSKADTFKLGVGESIASTYNSPPPATLVFAE